jgi:hypothetical protein
MPPNCFTIPDDAIPSSTSFSVSDFGDQRAMSGINTRWQLMPNMSIDGHATSNTLIRAVVVELTINVNTFTVGDQFTITKGIDELSVVTAITYASVASVPIGQRLVIVGQDYRLQWLENTTLTPTSSISNRYVRIMVFDDVATLRFTSRSVAGNQFNATYYALSSCPNGFVLSPDTSACMQVVLYRRILLASGG